MINIIKKYKVKNIMYSGVLAHSPIYTELLEIINQKKIALLIPQKEQKISLGANCQLNILYPFDNPQNKEVANLNNSSIVSRLECLGSSFLFTGDAEIEAEDEILKQNINIKSDVLKAGHHGSITSSQEEFLEKVAPQIAIVMVGENNKFNHPSLRTLKRLERVGAQIFRTDLNGTIDILNRGRGLEIQN
jgi:competence protein ComEC